MRVLLMGGPGPNFEEAARHLDTAGHEVVTCHDSDEPVFPCKAFTGACPLDQGHVDAAVVVRNHAWPRPTAFDRGTTCAIRQRVPVVMTGVSVLNPYEPWTDAVLQRGDDLSATLEAVVAAPLEQHANVATQALRASLRAAGIDPASASVQVTRRDGWLRAELRDIPEISRLKRQNTARRVISALRDFDRHALGVDVVYAGETEPDGVAWASNR